MPKSIYKENPSSLKHLLSTQGLLGNSFSLKASFLPPEPDIHPKHPLTHPFPFRPVFLQKSFYKNDGPHFIYGTPQSTHMGPMGGGGTPGFTTTLFLNPFCKMFGMERYISYQYSVFINITSERTYQDLLGKF